MKETKVTINLKENYLGFTIYLYILAFLSKINIKKIKVEKKRVLLDIEHSAESKNREKFIQMVGDNFNFFSVISTKYTY
jgi:hypothetical protein